MSNPLLQRRIDAVLWCQACSLHTGRVDWLQHNCQRATRTALGVGAGYKSAIIAWSHVNKADRHGNRNGPFGTPGYFDLGKYGHAVLLDYGHEMCWTTDFKRRGCYDLVPIRDIERHWGARWLGWAETINGARIISHTEAAS